MSEKITLLFPLTSTDLVARKTNEGPVGEGAIDQSGRHKARAPCVQTNKVGGGALEPENE